MHKIFQVGWIIATITDTGLIRKHSWKALIQAVWKVIDID